MTTTTTNNLRSPGRIAVDLGETPGRVEQAAALTCVVPTLIVNGQRLFDDAAVERIAARLKTDSRTH